MDEETKDILNLVVLQLSGSALCKMQSIDGSCRENPVKQRKQLSYKSKLYRVNQRVDVPIHLL